MYIRYLLLKVKCGIHGYKELVSLVKHFKPMTVRMQFIKIEYDLARPEDSAVSQNEQADAEPSELQEENHSERAAQLFR